MYHVHYELWGHMHVLCYWVQKWVAYMTYFILYVWHFDQQCGPHQPNINSTCTTQLNSTPNKMADKNHREQLWLYLCFQKRNMIFTHIYISSWKSIGYEIFFFWERALVMRLNLILGLQYIYALKMRIE